VTLLVVGFVLAVPLFVLWAYIQEQANALWASYPQPWVAATNDAAAYVGANGDVKLCASCAAEMLRNSPQLGRDVTLQREESTDACELCNEPLVRPSTA
jgi:hypothetical protein